MDDGYTKVSDNTWTVTVQEDGESKDLYIQLPPDAINQVGWDDGDTILWEELSNGSYKLSKKFDNV